MPSPWKDRDLNRRSPISSPGRVIGRIVGASGRTVARWLSGGTPHRSARERLLELAYVADQLIEVLGLSPDDANLWIFTPNRLLSGDKPADRIADGDYRSVLGLIEALADGVVASSPPPKSRSPALRYLGPLPPSSRYRVTYTAQIARLDSMTLNMRVLLSHWKPPHGGSVR